MVLEKKSGFLSNMPVFSAFGLKPFNIIFFTYSLFVSFIILRFILYIGKIFYINIPKEAVENGQSMPFGYARTLNYQEIYIILLALLVSLSIYSYLKVRQKTSFSFAFGIFSVWFVNIMFTLVSTFHFSFITNQKIIGLFNSVIFSASNLVPLITTAFLLFSSHKFINANKKLSANAKNKFIIFASVVFSISLISNLVTMTFGTLVNRSSFWTQKWHTVAKLSMPYKVYKPTYITSSFYPSKFINLSSIHQCTFEYLSPKRKITISIRQNSVEPNYNITEVFANRYKNNAVEAREIDFDLSKNNKAYLVNTNLTNTKTLSFVSPIDVQVNIISQAPSREVQISDDEIIKIAQSLK